MESDRRMQLWMAGGFFVVIVAVTVFAGMSSSGTIAPGSGFTATVTSAITAEDHTFGNKDAKVTVVEYGDFQCPACAAYESVMQQLKKEYGSEVLFVFRHFPLSQIHPNALISSQAAEAAGLQGKFWEMYDLLYQKQGEWSDVSTDTVVSKYFAGYAQSLGLDVQKFSTDITSATVKQRVQTDVTSANAADVNHTPTFFVNLAQIKNPNNLEEFKAIIDAALASSTLQ